MGSLMLVETWTYCIALYNLSVYQRKRCQCRHLQECSSGCSITALSAAA